MNADRYIDASTDLVEEKLEGGDVTEGVVRIGDTVRRPLNPQSAAIHAYLRHLERAGFEAAPRFLGIDDRGREVLSYVEGSMAGRPLNDWADREDLLVSIARLQRRLHACSLGFVLPTGVEWRPPLKIDGVPPLFDIPELVGHNDMTPENIIFRDHVPVGIIDFDLAGPTTRLADVLTTLRSWAPLCDPLDRDPLFRDLDASRRMRIFVDAYVLDDLDRQRLLDLAALRCTRTWHVMRYRAERDGGGWARMWREGVGDMILRSKKWLERERPHLENALER